MEIDTSNAAVLTCPHKDSCSFAIPASGNRITARTLDNNIMNQLHLKSLSLLAGVLLFHAGNSFATIYDITGTFTTRNTTGSVAGYIDSNITGTYNDSDPSSFTIYAGQPLFQLFWLAEGTIYDAGNYSFEACLADGSTNCTAPAPIGMDVYAGQWGAHLLFDWGSTTTNADQVLVWDVTNNPDGTILLTTTDPDGDGIAGTPMVDGSFAGFSTSYDLLLTPLAVPVPPALWLLGSGLLVLVGAARQKQAA